MSSNKSKIHKPDFPLLLQQYFCDYLLKQRNASAETVSSYRDTFRLFLRFRRSAFGSHPPH